MRGALVAVMLVSSLAVPAGASGCGPGVAPFPTVPRASLTFTAFESLDGVRYGMWRGTVPSFDGLPLSVDVTVPCDADGPLPLVSMNHGWTDDKTIWEETGRSDTVRSEFRPGSNSYWNNIWFASRGYAVLTYTARGWHDSCGPRTPGAVPVLAPAPQCLAFRYWVHSDDMRWEIRDTQWLTGALVSSGVADPARLAITGGSFGGGQTILNALLANRTMCSGVSLPLAPAPDACAGKPDGSFVPWTTPDGTRALRWAAAVPLYTWADAVQALAPNGRAWDDHRDTLEVEPLGIPKQSYIAGIFAAGQPIGNAYYAPPGFDPSADLWAQTGRTLAGNPFADPLAFETARQFREFRSPISVEPVEEVPIFWVQGFTDPLFTALEPLRMVNVLRAWRDDYPIKIFLGDIGHDYASERVDEWDHAHGLMNAFLDHYLADGPAPSFDVAAAVTRCLDPSSPASFVTGPDWGSLAPGSLSFGGSPGTVLVSAGLSGLPTDPVTGATLPLPGSYRGCRRLAAQDDPLSASVVMAVSDEIVLMGSPEVEVTFSTSAPDTQLHVRMWDVGGSEQGLVTRGVFRSLDGPGTGLRARFQLSPQGYRFAAGHTIKVEVAANDAPMFQQSNVPAVVVVQNVTVTLPTR